MKKTIVLAVIIFVFFCLTGCDRTPPEISGITDTVEADYGVKLNIEEYLNNNLTIRDETDSGTVEYRLSDLEHSVTSDSPIYDASTGSIDTTRPGEYPFQLNVEDKSSNKSSFGFTLRINPLTVENTVEEVIEMDCGTPFNVLDYLNDHIRITNGSGDVVYTMDELEHTIVCEESVYNAATGDYNTEKYGENTIALVFEGNTVKNGTIRFTVKVDALKMDNTVEDVVAMDCGTPFNVIAYFTENITITNQSGDVEYKLSDFDYSINCDESAYTASTGVFDTTKFGEYPITLSINSDSFENGRVSFTLKLNPLTIEKGYYVYKSEFASSGYEYFGFCEYKNISSENLEIQSIMFRYFDKDDVIISENDMPDYSLSYLKSGVSGYALDMFSSFNSIIRNEDEIAGIEVIIGYKKASGVDTTSLEVSEPEIIRDYPYNVSGFAGTAVITNPYSKDIEYYELLAGIYDKDGHLIGVMDSMDTTSIRAGTKARATVSWLPDSKAIPEKAVTLKASARVILWME